MSELMMGWKRTGMCAEFGKESVGKQVTLMGWVNSRRDLGGLIFLWLRDRSGLMQITFDRNDPACDFSKAETVRG